MNFKLFIKETLGTLYYHTFKKFQNTHGNRPLIYHAFGTKLSHDTYGISMDIKKFNEHMKYISDNYKVVEASNYSNQSLDTISITIDDGYKDTLNALEILDLYHIPVTIFITASYINKKNYMTNKDLYQISQYDSITIGAHGLSHKKLGTLSIEEQKSELHESKIVIENILGKKINSVSYPHGSYNRETFNILDNLKYQYAFSSIKGINNNLTNRFLLKRNEVISSDKVKDLEKKIKGYYDFY